MKQKINLFILLIVCNLAFSQDVLKVEYEQVNTVKPQLPESLPEHIKKQMLEELDKTKNYFLYHADGNVFFTNKDELFEKEADKEIEQVTEKKTVTKIQKVSITPTLFYHKKGENGVYIYRKSLDEEYYEYLEPLWSSVDYKDDTQKIDNFECKLVEITDNNGQIFKVWYTEQLPVSVGPYTFNNLPGLVLKIEAPTYTLYATKVSNEAKLTEVETMNPKLKVYKGEELLKKKEELSKPRTFKKTIKL